MLKRNKLWVGISAATLVGATSLTGCSPESESDNEPSSTTTQTLQTEETAKAAVALGGEGEGEGEGEGASKVDLATDDLAFLTHLALVRGHLLVGFKLYQEGNIEAAKAHIKHPENALYSEIAPAFEVRKTAGFSEELETLAANVEHEKETIAASYETLTAAISENEKAVGDDVNTPSKQLKLVAALLRNAGDEYAIAVIDGKIQNAHEYQSAYGFVSVAKSVIEGFDDGLVAKNDALELLDGLASLWPSLIPPETLSVEAGQIYGAAAKIELLALSL